MLWRLWILLYNSKECCHFCFIGTLNYLNFKLGLACCGHQIKSQLITSVLAERCFESALFVPSLGLSQSLRKAYAQNVRLPFSGSLLTERSSPHTAVILVVPCTVLFSLGQKYSRFSASILATCVVTAAFLRPKRPQNKELSPCQCLLLSFSSPPKYACFCSFSRTLRWLDFLMLPRVYSYLQEGWAIRNLSHHPRGRIRSTLILKTMKRNTYYYLMVRSLRMSLGIEIE